MSHFTLVILLIPSVTTTLPGSSTLYEAYVHFVVYCFPFEIAWISNTVGPNSIEGVPLIRPFEKISPLGSSGVIEYEVNGSSIAKVSGEIVEIGLRT